MNSQDHNDRFTTERFIPDQGDNIDNHPDAYNENQSDLPPIQFITNMDFAQIPKTQYLYRKFIVRGTTSLTVAASSKLETTATASKPAQRPQRKQQRRPPHCPKPSC